MNNSAKLSFVDKNQSFWQTGTILGSGFGLVSMFLGSQIAKDYGAGTAILCILLGNFLLWFVGLAIVSMTKERANTLENIRDFLGPFTASIAAVVIVASFLVWYAFQMTYLSPSIKALAGPGNTEIKISTALGFACAAIGMGGIWAIKRINIFCFPILAILLSYILMKNGKQVNFEGTWGLSFIGVILVILTWLPGTVNLSTFFRHSRSRAESILGLTLMSIIHILFQCGFVITGVSDPVDLVQNGLKSNNSIFLISIIAFYGLSFLCVNLLNIYWASIGWEAFFKHKQESKSYAITGILGTGIYIFFQSSALVSVIELLGTTFIANLGLTLIASYMTKIFIQHRVRLIDKLANSFCWFFSCFIAFIWAVFFGKDVIESVFVGISTCLLIFCLIIMMEETYWSIKNLPNKVKRF
jgi:hypothetical protein